MRLFVSYARVDKPYCQQVVDLLDAHDVWYDHRLQAGQHWWDEILRRLTWCEGFIYLLSRESVTSEYCQREFAIAQRLDKHIFPVLIHNNTTIPDSLKAIQYADLSNGFDARSVKHLLNAIYVTERDANAAQTPESTNVPQELSKPPDVDEVALIDEAAAALDEGNFDRAVFLLKRASENGYASRFIDLQTLLDEAEAALERQAYLREAEREYKTIMALVKYQRTFKAGCVAFLAFRETFPDFDPDNLAALCLAEAAPIIEWCAIPAGEVIFERGQKRSIYQVDAFRVSKYPITNAQFQLFVSAPGGYQNPHWWTYSSEACNWHEAHPNPLPSQFDSSEYPRTNLCWYEAMAFCFWLSEKTGMKIGLPTEQQWQRAAQGDSGFRYPWGNKFDPDRCNTKESELKMTTPVSYYPSGISPYGVFDMAGNIWEWCLNKYMVQSEDTPDEVKVNYAVRGGSYLGTRERAQSTFHFKLAPEYRYFSIGFRIVAVS
jgi:sulfatase-modifying factor enzyme 1/TIR domain-containing protein